MATPRKRPTTQEYGGRVAATSARGRPARGSDFATLLAKRVKAIKDRLASRPTGSRTHWQRLTWRSFATRIGMSEEALRLRVRRSAPIPFSAAELTTICTEFGVRPAYLVLGQEPMLDVDRVLDASTSRFADLLHRHMLRVLDLRTEQDEEWVSSLLPDADALLLAIEHGVADALSSNVAALVGDRRLANASVRLAVADQFRDGTPAPASPPEFFKAATTGVLDGTVIDLGDVDTE